MRKIFFLTMMLMLGFLVPHSAWGEDTEVFIEKWMTSFPGMNSAPWNDNGYNVLPPDTEYSDGNISISFAYKAVADPTAITLEATECIPVNGTSLRLPKGDFKMTLKGLDGKKITKFLFGGAATTNCYKASVGTMSVEQHVNNFGNMNSYPVWTAPAGGVDEVTFWIDPDQNVTYGYMYNKGTVAARIGSYYWYTTGGGTPVEPDPEPAVDPSKMFAFKNSATSAADVTIWNFSSDAKITTIAPGETGYLEPTTAFDYAIVGDGLPNTTDAKELLQITLPDGDKVKTANKSYYKGYNGIYYHVLNKNWKAGDTFEIEVLPVPAAPQFATLADLVAKYTNGEAVFTGSAVVTASNGSYSWLQQDNAAIKVNFPGLTVGSIVTGVTITGKSTYYYTVTAEPTTTGMGMIKPTTISVTEANTATYNNMYVELKDILALDENKGTNFADASLQFKDADGNRIRIMYDPTTKVAVPDKANYIGILTYYPSYGYSILTVFNASDIETIAVEPETPKTTTFNLAAGSGKVKVFNGDTNSQTSLRAWSELQEGPNEIEMVAAGVIVAEGLQTADKANLVVTLDGVAQTVEDYNADYDGVYVKVAYPDCQNKTYEVKYTEPVVATQTFKEYLDSWVSGAEPFKGELLVTFKENSGYVYMQDETAGARCYYTATAVNPALKPGDKVTNVNFSGKAAAYVTIKYSTTDPSLTVVSEGNAIEPVKINYADRTNYQCMVVTIDDVAVSTADEFKGYIGKNFGYENPDNGMNTSFEAIVGGNANDKLKIYPQVNNGSDLASAVIPVVGNYTGVIRTNYNPAYFYPLNAAAVETVVAPTPAIEKTKFTVTEGSKTVKLYNFETDELVAELPAGQTTEVELTGTASYAIAGMGATKNDKEWMQVTLPDGTTVPAQGYYNNFSNEGGVYYLVLPADYGKAFTISFIEPVKPTVFTVTEGSGNVALMTTDWNNKLIVTSSVELPAGQSTSVVLESGKYYEIVALGLDDANKSNLVVKLGDEVLPETRYGYSADYAAEGGVGCALQGLGDLAGKTFEITYTPVQEEPVEEPEGTYKGIITNWGENFAPAMPTSAATADVTYVYDNKISFTGTGFYYNANSGVAMFPTGSKVTIKALNGAKISQFQFGMGYSATQYPTFIGKEVNSGIHPTDGTVTYELGVANAEGIYPTWKASTAEGVEEITIDVTSGSLAAYNLSSGYYLGSPFTLTGYKEGGEDPTPAEPQDVWINNWTESFPGMAADALWNTFVNGYVLPSNMEFTDGNIGITFIYDEPAELGSLNCVNVSTTQLRFPGSNTCTMRVKALNGGKLNKFILGTGASTATRAYSCNGVGEIQFIKLPNNINTTEYEYPMWVAPEGGVESVDFTYDAGEGYMAYLYNLATSRYGMRIGSGYTFTPAGGDVPVVEPTVFNVAEGSGELVLINANEGSVVTKLIVGVNKVTLNDTEDDMYMLLANGLTNDEYKNNLVVKLGEETLDVEEAFEMGSYYGAYVQFTGDQVAGKTLDVTYTPQPITNFGEFIAALATGSSDTFVGEATITYMNADGYYLQGEDGAIYVTGTSSSLKQGDKLTNIYISHPANPYGGVSTTYNVLSWTVVSQGNVVEPVEITVADMGSALTGHSKYRNMLVTVKNITTQPTETQTVLPTLPENAVIFTQQGATAPQDVNAGIALIQGSNVADQKVYAEYTSFTGILYNSCIVAARSLADIDAVIPPAGISVDQAVINCNGQKGAYDWSPVEPTVMPTKKSVKVTGVDLTEDITVSVAEGSCVTPLATTITAAEAAAGFDLEMIVKATELPFSTVVTLTSGDYKTEVTVMGDKDILIYREVADLTAFQEAIKDLTEEAYFHIAADVTFYGDVNNKSFFTDGTVYMSTDTYYEYEDPNDWNAEPIYPIAQGDKVEGLVLRYTYMPSWMEGEPAIVNINIERDGLGSFGEIVAQNVEIAPVAIELGAFNEETLAQYANRLIKYNYVKFDGVTEGDTFADGTMPLVNEAGTVEGLFYSNWGAYDSPMNTEKVPTDFVNITGIAYVYPQWDSTVGQWGGYVDVPVIAPRTMADITEGTQPVEMVVITEEELYDFEEKVAAPVNEETPVMKFTVDTEYLKQAGTVALTGEGAAAFVLSTEAIAAGSATTDVTVTFKPAAVGTYAAQVVFGFGADSEFNKTFDLEAVAYDPENLPTVTVNPEALKMECIAGQKAEAEVEVTLANCFAPVTIEAAAANTTNLVSVSANEMTESGKLTFTFESKDVVSAVETFVFNTPLMAAPVEFIVTADAVTGLGLVTADAEGRFRVFNVNGMLMLDTDSAAAVRALPAGIYVINGVKIILK